jgi:hypothetical protein
MKDVSAIYVVHKRRNVGFFRKSSKEFCLEFRFLSVKVERQIYFLVFEIKLTGRKPFRGFNGLWLTSQQGNLMNHEVKTENVSYYFIHGALGSERVICCARHRVWDL